MPSAVGFRSFTPHLALRLRRLFAAALVAVGLSAAPVQAEEPHISRDCFSDSVLAEAMSPAADPDTARERLLKGQAIVAPAVVRDLVQWIGEHSDYDITTTLARPPSISFCDEGTDISYEGDRVTVDPLLRAAYDMEVRHIHLVQPWHASNVRDLSSLLHELIHDVQYLNRDWACKEEPEWEAYKLQEAWLAEQGVASGFNWTQILLFSRCPRDIHP